MKNATPNTVNALKNPVWQQIVAHTLKSPFSPIFIPPEMNNWAPLVYIFEYRMKFDKTRWSYPRNSDQNCTQGQ